MQVQVQHLGGVSWKSTVSAPTGAEGRAPARGEAWCRAGCRVEGRRVEGCRGKGVQHLLVAVAHVEVVEELDDVLAGEAEPGGQQLLLHHALHGLAPLAQAPLQQPLPLPDRQRLDVHLGGQVNRWTDGQVDSG